MITKGDKVRFLNDIGGGIVARIVGDMAYVEDEDGFEIPAKLSQIVLVAPKEPKATAKAVDTSAKKNDQVTRIADKNLEPMVFLALLQGDKAGSNSGDFRMHLVNDTPLSIIYLVLRSARTEGQFELMYKGECDAKQTIYIDKLPGRLLDEKSLTVQTLFFNPSGAFLVQKPVTTEVKIRSVRLLREGSFAKTAYFTENALLFPITKSLLGEKVDELKAQLKGDVDSSRSKPKQTTNLKPKAGEIVEIDLHIHELIDDIRGLSNGEMLKIQMDKFHQTIESHKNIKGVKLVFIHGVGNGTLKQEIIKCLKSQYKTLYYQDASFKEYGYGATMIVI